MFGTGAPIAALHGFTLTGAQFGALATAALQIHAADLPGHGATVVERVDVPTTIDAIAAWLAAFGAPVPLMGYSQGGRMALLTALDHPALVERLILISTSPGIADAEERRLRRHRDAVLADRIVEIGIDRFLDEWLAHPVTSGPRLCADAALADRTIREENTAAGLADALRGLGQGAQPYVGDRLRELSMPVLTVSGEWDERYARHAGDIAARVPDGRHVSIAGSGHNVVRDAPHPLTRAVVAFCAA